MGALVRREVVSPPTLEQLRRSAPWWWVCCRNARCLHKAPVALTPFIIRWGPDIERLSTCLCALLGLRAQGCRPPTRELGRFEHGLGPVPWITPPDSMRVDVSTLGLKALSAK
jgi:hypothetical protein